MYGLLTGKVTLERNNVPLLLCALKKCGEALSVRPFGRGMRPIASCVRACHMAKARNEEMDDWECRPIPCYRAAYAYSRIGRNGSRS